ncbi:MULTISPECIES: sulfite exporter TauE/SafE family protein [unclassified Arcicella]|uniref:sulfite exporter TauE/SafE family protein n=1 Tax=unclassified Arcicella TaxID=2644986 RepID=UPI002856C849|nr:MULTISPECIES: sulfite exporter TauE/SafE family protein [unclassified Arcicella]MDR6562039.1 putative membrane protein YfcA [Arcicella sp. BE51]MDR6811911.1 putative membrane protein YfcA [Arcicella sp. BE140]MDR6822941.1 putative membrane protein YfcA [Arcicella sp. BE139]
MENNQFLNKISVRLKLNNQFERSLMWVVAIAIYVIAFSIFIGKAPLLDAAYQAKEWLGPDFYLYLGVGLLAQLVDGSLGMAYGITSTSFLLGIGVPPALSSTSVHVSEMFTTGASAISHYQFKNINKKLFRALLWGVVGSVTGAYLLSEIIDGNFIKPYISLYMLILGVVILKKAFQKNIAKRKTKRVGLLAIFGGFMDAIGGGGWGPIVTSSLLGQGRNPRYAIGSVNAAEFLITLSSGLTFLFFEGVNSWQIILGLVLGGIIAAPFGAILINKIPRRPLMFIVGSVVIFLSFKTLWKVLPDLYLFISTVISHW